MKKSQPLLPLMFMLAGFLLSGMVSCSDKDDDEPKTPVIIPGGDGHEDGDSTEAGEKPDTTVAAKAAIGWPANYDGVMLQAFYWDSYSDTQWSVLTAQSDELSQYFQLIWIPNSGMTSDYYHSRRQTMGYDPCFWLDHNSCWGTEAELKQMVSTFRQRGTGIIEDVVINHKNGLTTWVDFPDESVGAYSVTWDNTNYSAICSNDECNSAANLSKWSSNGQKTTGAVDTGDNFDGYRDLDHTNTTVQENVNTYLSFLLNEVGYAGFRYDMVKGFSARYVGKYNATAQPQYSVGECWDSNKTVVTNWLNGTKQEGQIQSAAFDFPLKYHINTAFGSGSWSALSQAVLANDESYQRYAVTFVDNHDTYRENYRLRTNVCAANAFILCMPGTPCLFLKHWQQYKGTLKRLIAARRAAGITNQSKITAATASSNGYILSVQGTKGVLTLVLGAADVTLYDGQLVTEGKNFKLYADTGIDLSAVKAVTDEDAQPEDNMTVTIPDFCTVADGETCAFFEAPTTWGSQIKCWRWDNHYNYTGNQWPGVDCTLLGTATSGRKVWKWTFNATHRVSQSSTNEGIIFNDGTNQTADLPFQNGGYYTEDGLQGVVSAK